MKKISFVAGLIVAALLTGCGSGGVDESKPIDQVAAEAAEMGQAELQKMVDKYEAAIADKMAEIDVLKEKVKEIPLTEMMGEDAKALKDDISSITESVNSLKDRLTVYAKELSAQ